MLLGNAVLKSNFSKAKKTALHLLTFIFTFVIFANAGQAATVQTDSTLYYIGQTVNLTGDAYGLNELITIELTDQYGTVIDSWSVNTDLVGGGFLTKWDVPTTGSFGDTLTFTATGSSSTLEAQTSIVSPSEVLNQLQNGNGGAVSNWSNGNVNSSNSCYTEGDGVPYRYFHLDLAAGTQHYFKLECEASKGGIHALDYFTSYDLSEAAEIALAGGACGTISTTPPADCATPSATLAFPDPTISGNYVSIPTDMLDIVSGSFAVDSPRDLSAYNVVIDSMSQYSYTGTASDRTLEITIYFTTVDSGSVGFYWGGHLSEGTASTWGLGNGSASVAGAPYHTSVSGFDGAGGSGADRSVQGTTICLPPDPTITCSVPDSVCPGSTYTCSAPLGADIYTWSVTGASIVSGQGSALLTYTITGSTGGTVEISLETCNSTSGCSDNSCCADDVVQITIGDCSVPCTGTLACPADISIDCAQSIDTTVTGAPTWSSTGDCGTLVVDYSDQTTPGACESDYTITRTFYLIEQSSSDTLDNCIQTITVTDTTAPTFDLACPADATVDCGSVPTAPTMTATDDCITATVTFNETTTPGACAGSYTLTRVWTASDGCGNSTVCTQVITVTDTTAPLFDLACPADVTVECDAVPTAPSLTATDDCGTATVTFSESILPGAGDYTISRMWIAVDDCGNADTCNQTITVNDNTAPTFDQTCPADFTAECDAVPAAPTLTASDNCDVAPVVTMTESSIAGICDESYTLTRIWIATDDGGNADTCTQVVTVVDTNGPAFDSACPADITVDCGSIPTAPTLTASDLCDPDPTVSLNETTTQGACAGSYTLTRVWTASDNCGNSTVCTQVITVNDTTAPTFDIACPADATVDCGSVPTAPTLTATDDCGSATVSLVETTTPGACAGSYTITRVWTATDDCGNSNSCTQVITVDDTSAPTFDIACPADVTVDCNSIPAAQTLTATDDCGTATVTFSETTTPGACAGSYTITRVWTATDDCGNSDDCTQVVTVDDTSAPTFDIACPADATVDCNSIPTAPTLTATDDCGTAAVTFNETTTPGACAGSYTITRVWTATDDCGNSDDCTQVITVEDTTAPSFDLACPADMIVECDAIPTAPTLTATDDCGSATVTYSETTVPGAGTTYALVREWIAADDCGNADTCTQTITVNDTTAPIFDVACPADVTIDCGSIPIAPTLTATDNCDTPIIVTYTADTLLGNCEGYFTITRNWVAADNAGNSNTCTQILTVIDITAPIFDITCPADVTVDCGSVPTAPTLTATDNCGTATVTFNETTTPGACAGSYTITRVWTATDDCGNSDVCTQVITVDDTTAPIFDIACPSDTTVECDAIPTAPTITATDDCGSATVTFSESSVPGACVGSSTITRIWIAVDDCGNADTCTQVITVSDTTDPICSIPNDTTIVLCDATSICLPVTASDNCSSVSCSITSGPGTLAAGEWCYSASTSESVTVGISCVDECGNACVGSFTVTFVVNSAPQLTITAPTDISLCNAGDEVCATIVIVDPGNGISASSEIGTVDLGLGTVCFNADTSGFYCNTVIVSDSCGLADTASYCVTVIISDAPLLANDASFDFGLLCSDTSDCLTAPALLNAGNGPLTWTMNGLAYSPDTCVPYTLNTGTSSLNFVYIIQDQCGNADTASIAVAASFNSPPTFNYTAPTGASLCPDDTLCLGIQVNDIDTNLVSVTLITGPPGSYIEFPITGSNSIGVYCIVGGFTGSSTWVFEAVDACGEIVRDSSVFDIETRAPIQIAGASYDVFACNSYNMNFAIPEIIVGPIDSMLYDGNLVVGDSFSVNITSTGVTNYQFIAYGRCDFVDTATIVINATLNGPPVLTVDAPDSLSLCGDNTVCIPFSAVDPDNGLTYTSQLGEINEALGTICFIADSSGLYCDRVIVTDSCGAADTVDYCVQVVLDFTCICPIVTIEATDNTLQGGYETITVSIDDLAYGMGAYDFLISYDASVLSFITAEPGAMLLDCGWEYFTYRYGPSGNCGTSACPSGVLRITALAETSNGPNHPACFSTWSGELVDLTFLISNDRTYECQFAPIRFIWYDCGDNSISSIEGDTLFISSAVYDFDFGTDISDLGAAFPSYLGANSTCDIALGDGKPDPIRCINFVNGGVDIVCADSIDGRGDINLNEVEYEIADAVLFSNYFIYGLPVFTINPPGQIAASDVNADGISLSVADLVYLIRVIVGDALPYAKLTPKEIGYTFSEGVVSVSGRAGAAAITVSGNQSPSLINNGMDMIYAYDATNDITRILVSSMTQGAIFEGDFLQVGGDMISIEMATYEGAPVVAKLIPISFGLKQNYPNPFNPTTTISFELPRAGEFRLTIYNVQGQQVANISGSGRIGENDVTWDARPTASGVYFYRLEAFGQSDTKKMILLK